LQHKIARLIADRVSATVGTGAAKDETAPLSKLIDRLNDRFGTEFTQADQLFFDQVEEAAISDEDLQQSAQVNTIENFKFDFQKMLTGLFISRMGQNEDIVARFMQDQEFQSAVTAALLGSVYSRIRRPDAGSATA
jgi:type I restriction enzyme R subunit